MQLVLSTLLIVIYIAIGVADFKRHIIPNNFLIFLIIVNTVRAFLCAMLVKSIVCAAFMLLMCMGVYSVCRMIKKPYVFGAGDYKYLIVLGYCYGMDAMPKLCVIAFAAALIVYAVALVTKKSLVRIAAAPYLSLGAVVVELII